jgi:hypothetical protein
MLDPHIYIQCTYLKSLAISRFLGGEAEQPAALAVNVPARCGDDRHAIFVHADVTRAQTPRTTIHIYISVSQI